MQPINIRTDLPVLLLHNLDRTWTPDETEEALKQVAFLESAIREIGHPVINLPLHDASLPALLSPHRPEEHVVLNWCEEVPGMPHSDALVARVLEALRFAYTGSPPDVLALSWDKQKVKRLLERNGVPTPQWKIYDSSEPDGWKCFPAIVKPAHEHYSLGLTPDSVVLGPEDLHKRVAYVLDTFHQPALVEDFIDGREFHVSLWGNGLIEMWPAAEMDFTAFSDVRDRLCTFDSKFSPGSAHYDKITLRLPAPLSESENSSLKETACAAYRVVGCRDYARLDIRLRDGIFYVLDVNPNADLSAETSLALAAEAAGYSYGALGSLLVNLAAARHPVFGQSPPLSKIDQ